MCTEAERASEQSVYSERTVYTERAAEHEKEAQESSKRDTKEVLIPAAPLFKKGRPLKEPEQSSMQPGSWLSSVHTYVYTTCISLLCDYTYIYIPTIQWSRTQNYVCAGRTKQFPLCWFLWLARTLALISPVFARLKTGERRSLSINR